MALNRPFVKPVFTTFALLALSGCANVLAQVVPSHNQSFVVAKMPAGTYRLDPDHAAVTFEVSHMGFSSYVGRFNTLDATLELRPKVPETSRATATIDVASIDTNHRGLEEQLRGGDWFQANKHRSIIFRSTGLTILDERRGRMAGDLTMRGVTRPVTLDVTFNGGAHNMLTGRYTLGFAATTEIRRSEWGMTHLLPLVGDTVKITIHAEFQQAGK